MFSKAHHELRPYAFDASQRLEGTERTMFISIADDALGERRTDARKQLEFRRRSAIDVNNDGGIWLFDLGRFGQAGA